MLVFQLSHYNIIVLLAYPVNFLSSVTGVKLYYYFVDLFKIERESRAVLLRSALWDFFETSVTNESVDVPEVKNRTRKLGFSLINSVL